MILGVNEVYIGTICIGRDNANDEGNEPLYRVYKVGPVKLYTVESILRL